MPEERPCNHVAVGLGEVGLRSREQYNENEGSGYTVRLWERTARTEVLETQKPEILAWCRESNLAKSIGTLV